MRLTSVGITWMNLNCSDKVATAIPLWRWRALALCMLLLLLAASVQAQVTVTLELEKSRFLPRESMLAKIKIVNFSGQTLVFGEDDHWLQFQIESETGEEITPISDPPPVKGRFTVESSIRATKEVDVAPHYRLELTGRYTLTATVQIKQWGKQLTAKPIKFDITNGTVLWEQIFGLPLKKEDPPGQPRQVRRYVLQQAPGLEGLRMLAFPKVYYDKTDHTMKPKDKSRKDDFISISGTKMRKLAKQGAAPCTDPIPKDIVAANCIPQGFMVPTGWAVMVVSVPAQSRVSVSETASLTDRHCVCKW